MQSQDREATSGSVRRASNRSRPSMTPYTAVPTRIVHALRSSIAVGVSFQRISGRSNVVRMTSNTRVVTIELRDGRGGCSNNAVNIHSQRIADARPCGVPGPRRRADAPERNVSGKLARQKLRLLWTRRHDFLRSWSIRASTAGTIPTKRERQLEVGLDRARGCNGDKNERCLRLERFVVFTAGVVDDGPLCR